jgi:hypothetical protein
MRVRAKFEVTKVAEFGYSGKRQEIQRVVEASENAGVSYKRYESTGIPYREVTLSAVYTGSCENESFAESTPTGSIVMSISNPACKDEFVVGSYYYVDFTKAEK